MTNITYQDDSRSHARRLLVEVVEGDILEFAADVVAFKYAQSFYGADRRAAQALVDAGFELQALQPGVGDYSLVDSRSALPASRVLFVGVPALAQFSYPQIRDFGRIVVRTLAKHVRGCEHLALTLHGPRYGLDEIEALFSMLVGCVEALVDQQPPRLSLISVVERDVARTGRLRRALREVSVHGGELSLTETVHGWVVELERRTALTGSGTNEFARLPGAASEEKARIFVAMPFADEFSDLFEYGIQRPVRELGFLCERADVDVFTGDVLDRIKSKIETSTAIIGVLTGANPNVYLEIGYAWGKGRPTILVTDHTEKPRFDLQGQRYLKYRYIKDVEQMLTRELGALKEQGRI